MQPVVFVCLASVCDQGAHPRDAYVLLSALLMSVREL
jgi:hypothetical protein